eukprot:1109454-Amphidinium_carterae.1
MRCNNSLQKLVSGSQAADTSWTELLEEGAAVAVVLFVALFSVILKDSPSAESSPLRHALSRKPELNALATVHKQHNHLAEVLLF